MAMGIFEQLDWLTKRVNALCCLIENGGGGGGCGDCPIATTGSELGGDGTIANPLFFNAALPRFEESTFAPAFHDLLNINSVNVYKEFKYTLIGNTLFVWGMIYLDQTGGGWSFTMDLPGIATPTSFMDETEAIGFITRKEFTVPINSVSGTNKVIATDLSNAVLGPGFYSFSYTAKVQTQ
jgi:hypothetical protein